MKERQSNIELLRVISIMGIIILHYNNREIGGALLFSQEMRINHVLLIVLETTAICAVDLFILISGYFLCMTENRNILKPIQLIVQVMFFSACIYGVKCLLGYNNFSLKILLYSLIPDNYFAILHCALYIILSLTNLSLTRLTQKSFKKASLSRL